MQKFYEGFPKICLANLGYVFAISGATILRSMRNSSAPGAEVKVRLAKEIVGRYHSIEQADYAVGEFDQVFKK